MANNEQDRNTAPSVITEDALNHYKDRDTKIHTIRRGSAHQKDKMQPYPLEHRHNFTPRRSLHNPLNKHEPPGTDTENNNNYEYAACEK